MPLDIAPSPQNVTSGGLAPPSALLTPRARIVAELTDLAQSYGLTLAQLHALRPRVSQPRHHAMTVLRDHGWSYPRIGAFFGQNHATAIYGVRRHRERMG